MNGETQNLANDLRISVDWIAFTVVSNEYTVDDVVKFLGYESGHFTKMPKGGNGYKSMIKLDGYPVQILYDGKEDMGIHVSISGTAIAEVISKYRETLVCATPFGKAYLVENPDNTYMVEFLSAIRRIGHITRIDLAVDDIGSKYYTMDDLYAILMEKRVVSKFRNWKHMESRSISSGECLGSTIYLGSRKSDIMLRVYDKAKEQVSKLALEEAAENMIPWVRWELETKDERANQIVDMLINRQNLGSVTMGVLKNYFRVVVLDDSNKSRCSIDPLWETFITDVDKLCLYLPATPKTLDEKKDWFIRQVGPTLAGIYMAQGGNLDVVFDYMDSYIQRMSRDMQDLVKRHNPGVLESWWEAAS